MSDRWDFDSPASAVAALAARIRAVETERVALADAAGRVLAGAIRTDRPSPACDVSAMDGFAVRTSDLARGTLPVSGEIRIGQAPPDLVAETALRIVTGAPVPPSADAVVRREDVVERDGTITIDPERAAKTKAGENVRYRGENAPEGDLVIGGGALADGARTAALAAFGVASVEVHRRIRVRIVVTGDELVEVGLPASEWQVRDSNGPALAALLGRPWIELERAPRAPDERAALAATIGRALDGDGERAAADALLLTGGVSMGVHDYVPDTLRALGVEVLFHKLPQRPGKPILAGIAPGGRPVLALPGNPVSVLCTATRIALPALARRAGMTRIAARPMVRLAPASDRTIALWWQRPVVLEGDGLARIAPGRGSGDVVSAARSDGFVEIPPGVSGEGPFPFYAWGELR